MPSSLAIKELVGLRAPVSELAFCSSLSNLDYDMECEWVLGTEVVGKFFDYKFGHDVAHLQGEQHFTLKSLICNFKSRTQVLMCH
jgi:hypothetical protein